MEEELKIISSDKGSQISNSINDMDYEVMMSPILSNKLDNVDNKLENLDTNYNNITLKIDKIEEYLKENRDMYIDMLETINKVSSENRNILKENREMYTEALKKIEAAEVNNMNELRPVLNNMRNNNIRLENNMISPFYTSRVYNRFWRSGHIGNSSIPGILGLPFINNSSFLYGINQSEDNSS